MYSPYNITATDVRGNSTSYLRIGEVDFTLLDSILLTLKDVRHVPNFKYNMISLGCLELKGIIIKLKGGRYQLRVSNKIVLEG